LYFINSIRDRQAFRMIGNGNVLVTARDGRVRHRANISGAVAPSRVHLQIAPKVPAPLPGFGQPKATLRQGEKFFPQRRRTRRMLLLPNPLPDLLLKEWPDMR